MFGDQSDRHPSPPRLTSVGPLRQIVMRWPACPRHHGGSTPAVISADRAAADRGVPASFAVTFVRRALALRDRRFRPVAALGGSRPRWVDSCSIQSNQLALWCRPYQRRLGHRRRARRGSRQAAASGQGVGGLPDGFTTGAPAQIGRGFCHEFVTRTSAPRAGRGCAAVLAAARGCGCRFRW